MDNIKEKIYEINGMKVMLDYDLAKLFGYETKRFNERIRRNIDFFNNERRFQLDESELNDILMLKKNTSKDIIEDLRSQIATSSLRKSVSRKILYAFTLEGVKLLPNVLRGENVSNVTLKIIDAFKEKENEFKTIKNTDKIGTFSEIVKFESGDIILDINVSPEEDTVWLTQTDMAILFDTSKQNISLHILNIFNEKELLKDSVVKESLTTGLDGKKYNIMFYNLDVVISVGYRVKSKRGVEFRKWANNILKQYLLKGYTVNTKRCLEHSDIIFKLNDELNVLINNISKYDSKVKKIEKDIAMLKDNFIDPNSYAFFNYERRKNRGGFGIPNYI